jgi:hypothetical protein
VEEQGEVEEEAEKICSICSDAVDDSKSCRFACWMYTSFRSDYVQQANLPSLTACPDCGTTPDTNDHASRSLRHLLLVSTP